MPLGVGRGEGGEEAEGDVGGLHLDGDECCRMSVFVCVCIKVRQANEWSKCKESEGQLRRGQANTVAGVERM